MGTAAAAAPAIVSAIAAVIASGSAAEIASGFVAAGVGGAGAASRVRAVSPGCGVKMSTSTREASWPRRAARHRRVPHRRAWCRWRCRFRARVAASASMPSAAQRGRAGERAPAPPRWHKRACRRARKPRWRHRGRRTGGARARRASAPVPPARSRRQGPRLLPSPTTMREQAQVSARPKSEPKPRSRSSRSWAAAGSVAARRMIWAAEASPTSKRRRVQALTVAAPNIAAPTAFAHRICDPSALQSQAGHALVASAARRG